MKDGCFWQTVKLLAALVVAVFYVLWGAGLIGGALGRMVQAAEPTVGTASWFGPGDGVATQWCTWSLRTTEGCGSLMIRSEETGITVTAPVVDWCECYRGTPRERIVDLQWGVVDALGLDRADGLYRVTTWRLVGDVALPNTAMR